jgi:hypothetical protein
VTLESIVRLFDGIRDVQDEVCGLMMVMIHDGQCPPTALCHHKCVVYPLEF